MEDYFDATETLVKNWLKSRCDLGINHLKILFGRGGQNERIKYENCRILREIIGEYNLEIVGENTKVKNCISYLVCM